MTGHRWPLTCVAVLLLPLLSSSFSNVVRSQQLDYPSANLSTTWTNTPTMPHAVKFADGSAVRAILLRRSSAFFGPTFACGFFCNGTCTAFIFTVFIVYTNSGAQITLPTRGFPQVVWSANRDHPVKENATVQLTKDGDLVLADSDGTKVWSTNTPGKSVIGMNITELGNLVLFSNTGRNGTTVWQSFDHPTDSLVPGQKLFVGQRLVADSSATNTTPGLFYLSASAAGLFAYIKSDPPLLYYSKTVNSMNYVEYMNGSLSMFLSSSQVNSISVPVASSSQYMRLEKDGHLRVYEWGQTDVIWKVVADLLTNFLGNCAYPTVCGNYGICSNEQCSCPVGLGENSSQFTPVSSRDPSLGCVPITTLSCQESQNHRFLYLKDISHFSYVQDPDFSHIDEESCKNVCLKNCSCKAALFMYGTNLTDGSCHLLSQVFSLMNNDAKVTHYNSTAYIKVQMPADTRNGLVDSVQFSKGKDQTATIVGSVIGGLVGLILIAAFCVVMWKKKRDTEEEEDEDYFDQVPGMPARFSFEELKSATDNFCKKLGQGGFGSVFEGTLVSGIRIAVKRLDGIGQGKKQFIAEVETIGSVHHVNLVRLIGYCAEKTHRLLVYDYMCNGSLEKWIFLRNENTALDWQTRSNIILDVAKGLSYLHEECRQRIVHLDIKPQNILLDEVFSAKVSDFGLSKLIDRDQSHVTTTMRGTPGYLAPEWLSSKITEKVDVYSFGVVVLEITCGRKNLDYTESEENSHLVSLVKQKAEHDQLLDIVDKDIKNLHSHEEEAIEMLRIAIWCLQDDYTRRPSMSVVVNVLEGVMDVKTTMESGLSTSSPVGYTAGDIEGSTKLLASILSGPR